MKFNFEAKTQGGEIKKGKVDAFSKEAAVQMLQNNSLIPISIKEDRSAEDPLRDFKRIWEGINQREISIFFRQLATLIEAKVSIVTSLQAIAEQTENKYLKAVILQIIEDVQDGMPFSESLSKHPATFDALTINMVKAGEVSGNLQKSVLFIADNTEKNYELTSKIRGALFYPGFILVSATIIGFLVFTIVIPKLTGIFKDMNVEIPWYTKLLMNIGGFMNSYWWLILLFVASIVAAGIYYVRTEAGRRDWDQMKIKIPIIGKLFKYIYIARFAENLAVLIGGGIPIVRALIIVSDVVSNNIYQKIILRAADEVKKGGTISSVFLRSEEFPPIVSRMIKIGEDAGKVGEVLKNVSTFYEKETERITRNLTTLIEPILIVLMGIGVAILVFAILMPIYNIAGSIQ